MVKNPHLHLINPIGKPLCLFSAGPNDATTIIYSFPTSTTLMVSLANDDNRADVGLFQYLALRWIMIVNPRRHKMSLAMR